MGVWTFDMESGGEEDAGLSCPAAADDGDPAVAAEHAASAGFVVVAVPDGDGGLRLALQPVVPIVARWVEEAHER